MRSQRDAAARPPHLTQDECPGAPVSLAIKGDSSRLDLQAVMIKRVHMCKNRAGGLDAESRCAEDLPSSLRAVRVEVIGNFSAGSQPRGS